MLFRWFYPALMLFTLSVGQCHGQSAPCPLPEAHAHNDYEHPHPLFDALAHGFTEVEVDVHLMDGELYVAHDTPAKKDSTRTLRHLYLRPLRTRIQAQNGQVYHRYRDHFYLMIDLKTPADVTYPVLRSQLAEFADILSAVRDTVGERHKPVKVFLSGHRPALPVIQQDSVHWVSLDGRPNDLGRHVPVALMPVVSTHFNHIMRWRGVGSIDTQDIYNLQTFVSRVHAEGKKVRFWGAPDSPACWRLLLSAGVDLINTDQLEAFSDFRSK
jgi:glycerophosphoryl diester phosphodiesterase